MVAIALAALVTVNPGSYSGRYRVNGTFGAGVTQLDLPAGTFEFDDGYAISGSSFTFAVDGSGNVTTSFPAAHGGAGTLTIDNVTVHVAPGTYPYAYCPTAGSTTGLTGAQNLSLIAGLTYGLDDCAFLANSNFLYSLDSFGNVS